MEILPNDQLVSKTEPQILRDPCQKAGELLSSDPSVFIEPCG
jgi:hypothetical protein